MYNLSKQTSMYLCSHVKEKEQIMTLLTLKCTQSLTSNFPASPIVLEEWVVNNELWRVQEKVIVDYFNTDFICQK